MGNTALVVLRYSSVKLVQIKSPARTMFHSCFGMSYLFKKSCDTSFSKKDAIMTIVRNIYVAFYDKQRASVNPKLFPFGGPECVKVCLAFRIRSSLLMNFYRRQLSHFFHIRPRKNTIFLSSTLWIFMNI